MSARRRRELRWIFAVIFAVGATPSVLGARAVPFAQAQSLSTLAAGTASILTADLDGDSDLDVATAVADEIAWYPNTDGRGALGPKQVLASAAGGAVSALVADLDGDGDLDILSTSTGSDEIAWYENSDGKGTFASQQVLSSLAGGFSCIVAADLDRDGHLDVIVTSAADGRVVWYPSTDGGGALGAEQNLPPSAAGADAVLTADLDRDGDLDVLTSSASNDEIAWYENSDGSGHFGPQQILTSLAAGVASVLVADLDGDGDLDLLAVLPGSDEIAWLTNLDGEGGFGSLQILSSSATGIASVFAADIDTDGDLDVLAASTGSGEIGWFENTDGAGHFASQQLVSTSANGVTSVLAADLDGDGDLDAIAAALGNAEIAWYENETIHRSAHFPDRSAIFEMATGARTVVAADLDGDGDLDLLLGSGTDATISWYENSDGKGSFGTRRIVSTLAEGVQSVVAADIDRDGDLDVLSASRNDDKVAWYENSDGHGAFGTQQIISTLADDPFSVAAADLDGDGDLDAISASRYDGEIAWYENSDGHGAFGTQQIVSTLADGVRSVHAADLDHDGDLDLLSASQFDDEIAWYENLDGSGTFGAQQLISTLLNGGMSAIAADLDGDGDLDVLAASRFDDKLAWYENSDGRGHFGSQRVLTTVADGAMSIAAADLDSDGDLDVLSATRLGSEIAWYENSDGGGNFTLRHIISTLADTPFSVIAADLDGDGDLDAVSASTGDDTIAWYENRGGQFSLATTNVAQGLVASSELHDLLSITVNHEGRAGDTAVELASLGLRLTDGSGTALTEEQAESLFAELRLYLDNGSSVGAFDPSDILVASTTDFSSMTLLGDGVLRWILPDDNAALRVVLGTPRTYFLTAALTSNIESQAPGSFVLTHRTESSSEGEDADHDIPLTLEYTPDQGTGRVDTVLSSASCQAPFDLQLADRTVGEAVTCAAGTTLAVDGVLIVANGALTLRAGQSIEIGDFTVAGGTLSAGIDPDLEP
jgi:FG-GAP-like repeat